MSGSPSSLNRSGNVSLHRRRLLVVCLVALVYPLLRFIGFRVPKKPRKIEINSSTPISGVLIHSDFILFDRDDRCWALSRKCTHLGCKLNYHEQENLLECPCHQSRFTTDGRVINGPAKKSLTMYKAEKRKQPPYYIVTV